MQNLVIVSTCIAVCVAIFIYLYLRRLRFQRLWRFYEKLARRRNFLTLCGVLLQEREKDSTVFLLLYHNVTRLLGYATRGLVRSIVASMEAHGDFFVSDMSSAKIISFAMALEHADADEAKQLAQALHRALLDFSQSDEFAHAVRLVEDGYCQLTDYPKTHLQGAISVFEMIEFVAQGLPAPFIVPYETAREHLRILKLKENA